MLGSNNTITVTGDANDTAPDLDWIEVVDVASTVPVDRPLPAKPVERHVLGQRQRRQPRRRLCQPQQRLPRRVDPATSTRWTSGTASYTGQYVQVDFTGTVNLSTITLDNSNDGSANDFPGTYAVYTSQDGVTFSTTPVATGSGAANQTIISFTQEAVRAIRIKAMATNGSGGWWSIGNIQTDCNLAP